MNLAGFGNYHQTEALKGALPSDQNSPQSAPFDLYPEQINGTAFTMPRQLNLHSWLYRKNPSVLFNNFTPYTSAILSSPLHPQTPNPLRWSPQLSNDAVDWLDGLFHIAKNQQLACFTYHCQKSMIKRYFANRDGELLFVPYNGRIRIHTEFGQLCISPGMIAVIPRGIYFKIELLDKQAHGYVCENSGSPLTLPELGPIGANGLANPRHFIYPHAMTETNSNDLMLICKYSNQLWQSKTQYTPLNVVAWQGNYAPYSYDLSLFNTINTVSFDHPDPSIFTVLTSASGIQGQANLDFVIFPPRWMVANHTFRPPYFHRNFMSELMGLVCGNYDAKESGFVAGGVSIHNCMTPHGPDFLSFNKASQTHLKPEYYEDTLAFMLESNSPWQVTEKAYDHESRDKDYADCWQGFARQNP